MKKRPVENYLSKLSQEERLFLALSKSRILMRRAAEPYLKKFDLTAKTYHLLRIIKNTPGCTLSEAGERLFSQAATVTTLTRQLKNQDLISIQAHKNDARTKQLFLTIDGKRIITQLHSIINKLPERLSIPDKQIDQLTNDIEDFNEKLLAS